MTRRRWIADEVSGNRAALTGNHARHLTQVLRAQVGQHFDVSTGTAVRSATVTSVRADRVEFELGEAIAQAELAPITVAISIFKFDRMEWAIEKCAELGIMRMVPVIAARTEKHLAAAAAKRVERWRRLVHQAAEQCRRTSSPEIAKPIKFQELLAIAHQTKIVLSEVERELTLKDTLPPDANSALLAFGPEGGWTDQELAAFAEAGWASASLGDTILRAETAVITAVAVVASVLQS